MAHQSVSVILWPMKRTVLVSSFVVQALLLLASFEPVCAQFSPWGMMPQSSAVAGNLSDSLRNIDSNTDQVIKRVQSFLQGSGRWFPQPQGNDLQVCQMLQAFKQQLTQVRRRAGASLTPEMQIQLGQLQALLPDVIAAMQRSGMDPGTIGQTQMLQDSLRQTIAASSISTGGSPINPFWSMGQPNPYVGSPMFEMSQPGRGQLLVMGQPFMRFRQVSVETIDPVSRRVRATFTSGGRDNLVLSGAITSQTLSAVTVAVDSSDKGVANGTLSINFESNGSIGIINSSGSMNGQAFTVVFNSH